MILGGNYTDVWAEMNDLNEKPGYTMKETPKFKPWRPDRVILKKE
jgi:hypothetical protein